MTQIAYSGLSWTQFRVSRDLFADLTAGKATVWTFLPRLLTAASRIQNCTYRKKITYQTPQSNLPIFCIFFCAGMGHKYWVMQSLDNFFVVTLDNPLSGRWNKTPSRSCHHYGLRNNLANSIMYFAPLSSLINFNKYVVILIPLTNPYSATQNILFYTFSLLAYIFILVYFILHIF